MSSMLLLVSQGFGMKLCRFCAVDKIESNSSATCGVLGLTGVPLSIIII